MTETETARPTYTTRFVEDGRTVQCDNPALTIGEMVACVLEYMPIPPAATFENYRAALDERNRFVDFCIAETVDDTGAWCDPTRSFRDLWSKFIEASGHV